MRHPWLQVNLITFTDIIGMGLMLFLATSLVL